MGKCGVNSLIIMYVFIYNWLTDVLSKLTAAPLPNVI